MVQTSKLDTSSKTGISVVFSLVSMYLLGKFTNFADPLTFVYIWMGLNCLLLAWILGFKFAIMLIVCFCVYILVGDWIITAWTNWMATHPHIPSISEYSTVFYICLVICLLLTMLKFGFFKGLFFTAALLTIFVLLGRFWNVCIVG